MLLRRLPQFGESNWTSTLRRHFPGLSPFKGRSIADFCYDDAQGALTEFLFDANTRKKWKGRWPTYYLEVKTTAWTKDVAFHLSAQQLETVRRPGVLLACLGVLAHEERDCAASRPQG